MKNIIIITLSLFISYSSYATNVLNSYECVQEDTQPWGCASKSQISEPNMFGGQNFKLRCIGAGLVVCEFSDGTCPLVVSDAADDIATAISNGTLTGTVIETWGSYSWAATDINNYEYTIEHETEE